MTTPTPEAPKPEKLVLGLNLTPDQTTMLDRLKASHAAVEAAKKQYEECRAQLLAAVTSQMIDEVQAAEGSSRIPDEYVLVGTPVRVSWTTSMRIDSKRLKAELPTVYDGYAKLSGAWRVTGL